MTEPFDMTLKQLDSQRIQKESAANEGLPQACTEEGALFKVTKEKITDIVESPALISSAL